MYQAFEMPFASIAMFLLILIILFFFHCSAALFFGGLSVVKMPQRPLTAGTRSLTEIVNVSYK